MATTSKIALPDIGDFDEVEVIEILVSVGETVEIEQPLVTLETDKASMDVPSTEAGVVRSIAVTVGDRISQGSIICEIEPTPAASASEAQPASPPDTAPAPATAPPVSAAPVPVQASNADEIHTEVLVLGAGPGGYTAAFRSADLGKKTILVERYPALGGVCLNVGCIPSKALLHTAAVIDAAREIAAHGVSFGEPTLDIEKIRGWKDSVVAKLTKGLAGLASQRKVQVIHGAGEFTSPHTLRVSGADGKQTIRFEHAIIAAGSQATQIPVFPNDDPRLVDSTGALELTDIPARMLVIGGGIIGLEMATVYAALGTRITVVELLDGLMPGADKDLVRPLQKRIEKRYENIFTGTRVTGISSTDAGLEVSFDGPNAPASDVFDRVLVAVGRRPNGLNIGAAAAGVAVQESGFIEVDRQQRTNVAHIFAIGDIVGQPMLAHKATHEGKVAAEVTAGHKASFDALTIPSVAYTDPEIAWMGLTEEQAKADGIEYETGVFPWAASGRALGIGRDEGLTKILVDPQSRRLLGAGIVGPHAGDLIAEAVVALELGADAEDLSLTIHPHPTLSETLNFAAEMVEGTITDLYIPKRKSKN
jgi:dihydrolipoamide dehydrogenase